MNLWCGSSSWTLCDPFAFLCETGGVVRLKSEKTSRRRQQRSKIFSSRVRVWKFFSAEASPQKRKAKKRRNEKATERKSEKAKNTKRATKKRNDKPPRETSQKFAQRQLSSHVVYGCKRVLQTTARRSTPSRGEKQAVSTTEREITHWMGAGHENIPRTSNTYEYKYQLTST